MGGGGGGWRQKCNYYHRLAQTPRGPAGLGWRGHTYTHTVFGTNKRTQTETSFPKFALTVESINNGTAETNRGMLSAAPADREELCVSRREVEDEVSRLHPPSTRETGHALSVSTSSHPSPPQPNPHGQSDTFWCLCKLPGGLGRLADPFHLFAISVSSARESVWLGFKGQLLPLAAVWNSLALPSGESPGNRNHSQAECACLFWADWGYSRSWSSFHFLDSVRMPVPDIHELSG